MRPTAVWLLAVWLSALASTAPTPAAAAERSIGLVGFGPRVGVSLDPNQIVFGGHGDFGDLFPHTTWYLPVLEVGLGDNITIVSVGTDLLYRVNRTSERWNPYAGGELAVLFLSADEAGDQTDLALSGVFGLERDLGGGNRFAAELKFEIIDAPNVKLLAHWTFAK